MFYSQKILNLIDISEFIMKSETSKTPNKGVKFADFKEVNDGFELSLVELDEPQQTTADTKSRKFKLKILNFLIFPI